MAALSWSRTTARGNPSLQVRWSLPQRSARIAALPTATLPNGLKAAYISRNDLFFLYHEVYEQQSYLQHSIQLQPGDTVLDIGANVGLFSLFAAAAVGSEGRVVAAEPIPAIFAAMEQNIVTHMGWTQMKGHDCAAIEIQNVGVADGRAKAGNFTFYPRAAGWSSMRPDSNEVQAAMEVFLGNALQSGDALPPSFLLSCGQTLRQFLPEVAFQAVSRAFVSYMLSGKQQFTCKLVTVSELIWQHQLKQVDLLKVDVERAEVEVLRGVSEEHWPAVRQVVVEAHDLAAVQAILQGAGFDEIVADQGSELKGSKLHTVYARRKTQ